MKITVCRLSFSPRESFTKAIRIMRLIAIILLGLCLQVTAKGVSQTINLSGKSMPLEKVFKEIKRQTGYVVIYNYDLVRKGRPVTVNVKDSDLEYFMQLILQGQPLEFSILNSTISIRAKAIPSDDLQPIASVPIDIRGRVTNEKGEPVSGASVMIKGENQGTVTNDDGWYNLRVPDDGILIVSYVGYVGVEERVAGRTTINIRLVSVEDDLSEVVTVGYGKIRKSDLTGSIAKLEVKDVEQTPVVSIDQFLQGRVAGVQITQNTGAPGSGVTFLIRGAGSVTGSSQPLIILDGYPIESSSSTVSPTTGATNWTSDMPRSNALANLNPNDIESIEVLKDASATAIYGSRGANGVVLITTRRGAVGKEKIAVNSRVDISGLRKTIDVLNTAEYIAFANEARLNSGLDSVYRWQQIAELQGIDNNWQDLVYQQGLSQSHQVNLGGGVEKFKYLLSLNYLGAEGIVKNSGYSRGSIRLNIDRQVSQRFKIGLNTNAVMSTGRMATQSHSNGAPTGSMVIGSLILRPIEQPFSDEMTGDPNTDLEGNPLTLVNRLKDHSQTRSLILSAFAEYKITDHLSFHFNGGVNSIQTTREVYHPRGTNIGNVNNGMAIRIESANFNYLNEYTLNYNRKIRGRHSVNAVTGYTWQSWNTKSIGVTATNFPNDNLGYNNFQIASGSQIPVNSNVNWSLASFLGRVNYVFDDRYLVTFTGRMDGSTRLAENKKWAFFPSAAVGWNIHNENFMSGVSAVSNLKLRASYGLSGNQAIGVGATQSTLMPIRRAYGGGIVTALTLSSFENPDLHWETTGQLNLGFEVGFFRNRLHIGVDYYDRHTRDLLVNLSLPGSAGFRSYAANSGEISNKGLEIEVEGRILQGGKLKWTTGGNISFNRNTVVNLGKSGQIIGPPFLQSGSLQMNSAVHRAIPGYPIGAFYGFRILGIYQNQEEIDKGPVDPANPQPGDFRFSDENGDGRISIDDMTIIGNPYPKYSFGFSNDLQYGSFSVSILFAGNIGQDVANLNRFQLDGNYAGFLLNVSREAYLNRWTGEGTSDKYPRATAAGISFRQRFSDFIVEKASFVRLRNLSVAYRLPTKNWRWVENIRVFVSGNNLLTFTNYSGYDPEINARGDNSLTPGVDFGSIPQVRTFSAGFTFNF